MAASSSVYSSESTSAHRFIQKQGRRRHATAQAWVTVPVPDPSGTVQFKPRGFDEQSQSLGSSSWDVKPRYMMATRSGPTECPDHILCKHKEFKRELANFPSPFALYYFDETAPNNTLLANDLHIDSMKPDNQRLPTMRDAACSGKVSKKDAMEYSLRKMFFDVDDIRVAENGSGMKMFPSYTTSYQNYPAICYDVVTPTNYNEFFRIRRRPGMFA